MNNKGLIKRGQKTMDKAAAVLLIGGLFFATGYQYLGPKKLEGRALWGRALEIRQGDSMNNEEPMIDYRLMLNTQKGLYELRVIASKKEVIALRERIASHNYRVRVGAGEYTTQGEFKLSQDMVPERELGNLDGKPVKYGDASIESIVVK